MRGANLEFRIGTRTKILLHLTQRFAQRRMRALGYANPLRGFANREDVIANASRSGAGHREDQPLGPSNDIRISRSWSEECLGIWQTLEREDRGIA